MEFKDRLKEYRISLGITLKNEMAKRLGIARTLYSMLENGTREPSKDVLEKLFIDSDKPSEYWTYGITDIKEYLSIREEFKCSRDAFEQLSELGEIEAGKEFSVEAKEILAAAAFADAMHLLEKKQSLKSIDIKGDK
ncbi:helix-turn-helix domain-containing protein [Clostridium tagluense]|uniref:HTH cro/C1-type domain-containing protein n=1 Tax=Clostridium tagluense TaxID=360422 RepID=A0A401UU66_9CLOT|nr:helix-turn-helix transcriptional regulator [Clostridium tagluense]GCD13046.1 hypothetical protein Ctaglu_46690 [Clostridium tagluense]